jgi:hypothetical protein
MGVFVTSTASVSRHGVFAIARTPPAIIKAIGTGVACIVGVFPWGPDSADSGVETPTDVGARANTFAPPGMSRTGDGYLSTIAKGFPTLKVVRVLGSAAAKASAALLETATPIITVTLKYKGTAGNSVDCVVSDATDGDANHFNLTVRVTGTSGTTEDVFENLNYSGTGDDSTPDVTNAYLVGSITKSNAGRPDNGTTICTGGLDGTIDSSRYIGTAGAGNYGIASAENDKAIRVIFCDDPGDTDRAAVMAGLAAHALLMGDRLAVTHGDSGLSASAAQTAAGVNRSIWVVFADVWPRIYDDTDGTLRLVSPSSFAAAVISQVSPSTSPAWKAGEVGEMLNGIVNLETPRGNAVGDMTTAGAMSLIQEEDGSFRYEAGVLTTSEISQRNITRTRMGSYIATSFVRSVRGRVDSPNVPLNQTLLVDALERFMVPLKKAQGRDPDHTPHVLDYGILSLEAANDQAALDAGDFTIPLDVKTSSAQERIFLSIQFGETVTVGLS